MIYYNNICNESILIFSAKYFLMYIFYFLDGMIRWTYDFSAATLIWHWKRLLSNHFLWYCSRWMCYYWLNYSPTLAHLHCLEFLSFVVGIISMFAARDKFVHSSVSLARVTYRSKIVGSGYVHSRSPAHILPDYSAKELYHLWCNDQKLVVLQSLTLKILVIL